MFSNDRALHIISKITENGIFKKKKVHDAFFAFLVLFIGSAFTIKVFSESFGKA